jgi:hypothetical protein
MAPDWAILNDPELIGFLFDTVQRDHVGDEAQPA